MAVDLTITEENGLSVVNNPVVIEVVNATAPEGGGGGAPDPHASTHGAAGSDPVALSGTQITSGVIAPARLGTGTTDAYHFLDGSGTWNDDVPVLVPCKNTTASTILKGAPVYVTGTVGATSVIEVAPADADNAATMPAIGLVNTDLTANATGYVVVVGSLKGLDTNSYSINQALYVSTTAGTLTGTKPTGSTDLIQNIGRVTRVNANSGEVLVLGPGRTNDVPNAIDAGKLTSGTVAYARLPVGTTSSTVAAGDDSRLTDSRSPSGSAGGDLTGTYPNPTIASGAVTSAKIADGTIVNADISASAAIATSKISGLAAIATSGSGSDITSGTVAVARLGSQAPPTPTPYASNDWVPLWNDVGSGVATNTIAGTASSSNNVVRYQPLWIGQTVSLIGLGIDVSAANAGASAVVRLGLYNDSAGRPGTVAVDAGTASLNTAVAKELTFSAVSLAPGWYWLAIATQSLDTAGTNPAFRSVSGSPSLAPRTSVPSATASQPGIFTSSSITGAFGASPTVSVSASNVLAFLIWGKFA